MAGVFAPDAPTSYHPERQSRATDLLVLDPDDFIGLLEKTLGRVVRRKKPGLKKDGDVQLNRVIPELGGSPKGSVIRLSNHRVTKYAMSATAAPISRDTPNVTPTIIPANAFLDIPYCVRYASKDK